MKKKLLAILLSVATVCSLVGCGTAKSAPEKSEAPEAEAVAEAETETETKTKADVTLTFMASQDWIQDAEIELAEKFTEETGIKVDYQIVPADQYANLLSTKLNTGECTDIFAAQSGKFDIVSQFNVEKNAVDLTDASWAGKVDELAAVELSANGKLYGQPIQDVSAVWAVAYNIPLFEELGLSVPTDYNSFMEVCEAIKGSGVIPVYEAVSDGWHHVLWFLESGVSVEAANPGTVDALNSNEQVFAGNKGLTTILDQMNEMIEKGYWGDNYMSNEYANAAANIASGEYSMTIANQGFGDEVNAVNPDIAVEDIGYFVIPLNDNQVLNVNPAGPARFISSTSKHVEEAKQYLEYLAREESLTYLTENVAKFNKLAFTNAPTMYNDTIQTFYDRYDLQGTVLQTSVKYVNPQWGDIGASLSAMFVGDMSSAEVLEKIDKLRVEQAAAASDPAWN